MCVGEGGQTIVATCVCVCTYVDLKAVAAGVVEE